MTVNDDKTPKLQNIPLRTEEARAIRDAFHKHVGPVLPKTDYASLELRALAQFEDFFGGDR